MCVYVSVCCVSVFQGLEQKIYSISLERLVVAESKEGLKKKKYPPLVGVCFKFLKRLRALKKKSVRNKLKALLMGKPGNI